MDDVLALIEGGGTTFRCERATRGGEILASTAFPTTTPDETLARVVEFFRAGPRPVAAGIACFGPLDVDHASPSYGRILATPKPGWSGADVRGAIASSLSVPVAIHTDVVCAALGEWTKGAAKGARCAVYVTCGTGVGAGALLNGDPIGGANHPEFGHVRVARESGDSFAGVCPFHGDCLEGLASGPAITARAGTPSESLAEDHPARVLAARYLGQAFASLALILAPDVIVLGGGVPRGAALLPRVRSATAESLAGYLTGWKTSQDLERRVVAPALGDRSALEGARTLIEREFRIAAHVAADTQTIVTDSS